ncbi:MAG: cytochrome P450 [Gammaproteobacteria bacterium]
MTATLTVPGPKPLPLLGAHANVYRFVRDPIGYTGQLFGRYGPIAALSSEGRTNIYSPHPNCPGTVFAYGPEMVREVSTCHDIYYKYPLTGTPPSVTFDSRRTAALKHFGTGLFGVNGEEHRLRRRLVAPAFHRQRVDSYRDVMVQVTQSVLDRWQPDESRDIGEDMRLLTSRVASATLFGEDLGERGLLLANLMRRTLAVQSSPFARLLPFDVPGLPFHRFLDLVNDYDREIRQILARKRLSGADKGDMLSMLMPACADGLDTALTDDELLGHTSVFLAAGLETSANALTWTLFLLSQHPKVMVDLVDELTAVLHGAPPTVAQLERLPLLDHVIKESMRVISPVPFNGRVTSHAASLAGYVLPAGTEVFVSIYHTHKMPELYPDPNLFNPSRWDNIQPSIFEYNPFSAGPRMCIGSQFAMLEMKIVLGMLLQRYRLELVRSQIIDRVGVIVLAPKHGVVMTVHHQDRQFGRGVGGVHGNVHEMVVLPN